MSHKSSIVCILQLKDPSLLSPYCHLSIHTIMELRGDVHKLVSASKPKDIPQEVSLHSGTNDVVNIPSGQDLPSSKESCVI